MSTAKPLPALNVLGPPRSSVDEGEDAEMHECSPEPVKSPKGGGSAKNTLGLILPGTNAAIFPHSIDSMLTTTQFGAVGAGINSRHHPGPRSPPMRIILETDKQQPPAPSVNILLKTPPLICEQGPSAPSSPTTPSPGARSAKRPCPLSVDALQRLNLLSPNYLPQTMDAGKLPPVSPGYPTSDLGSSPRSSISASHYSALGINPANWSAFRDAYTRRHGAGSADGDDGGSECGGGGDGKERHSSLLLHSPHHQLLSPAPFSPFSDCGVADLHVCASASGTPYSSRSPNLSPSPMRRSSNLHFSFEQIRSRSSLSNHHASATAQDGGQHRLAAIAQPRSLDMDARERSRSEGEALAGNGKAEAHQSGEEDERMDTGHGHSTLSVPACSGGGHLHAGQKRRRLLQKSRRAAEDEEGNCREERRRSTGQTTAAVSQQDSLPGPSASQMPSRQPTIEEPPPSPTLAELFQPGDLDKERRKQVEDWIRQQTAALEAFRHSLIPPQQEANLLQVPSLVPQNSLEQLWPSPSEATSQVGPIRSPTTLWRRSRSESDVSAATAASAIAGGGGGGGGTGRRRSQQPPPPQLMVPLNEATHVCEHCGQGFSMHDRLAKHIASRHRDRSASMNDENSRIHKCTLCPKSFGRSDMLTRHMRLHSGLKPYACHLCGQVFSRSDHLSTHQRTHTGEKPYRCPQCNYSASRRDMITRHMRTHLLGADGTPVAFAELQIPPINELSLNAPAPPPPSTNASPQHQPSPRAAVVESSPTPPLRQQEPQQGSLEQPPPLQRMDLAAAAPATPNINEQIAKLLSAAVANGTAGLLSPQFMLNSLGAQLPAHLRRSTPNLLGAGDYPSAFRPPFGPTPSCPTTTTTAAFDPTIAAAAAAQVQQLISQQQQNAAALQRLSLPSGAGNTAPCVPSFLFRQNSFGGLGFSEQQQQAVQLQQTKPPEWPK